MFDKCQSTEINGHLHKSFCSTFRGIVQNDILHTEGMCGHDFNITDLIIYEDNYTLCCLDENKLRTKSIPYSTFLKCG
jgi:hypothetical protein